MATLVKVQYEQYSENIIVNKSNSDELEALLNREDVIGWDIVRQGEFKFESDVRMNKTLVEAKPLKSTITLYRGWKTSKREEFSLFDNLSVGVVFVDMLKSKIVSKLFPKGLKFQTDLTCSKGGTNYKVIGNFKYKGMKLSFQYDRDLSAA